MIFGTILSQFGLCPFLAGEINPFLKIYSYSVYSERKNCGGIFENMPLAIFPPNKKDIKPAKRKHPEIRGK